MFACLFVPSAAAAGPGCESNALEAVARGFSPRVEVHDPGMVTLDVDGLQRLLGGPDVIGRELLRDARDRGCDAHVALAATRAAARLLAIARPGLTVALPGAERRELSPLPLAVLACLAERDASMSRTPAFRLGTHGASGRQAKEAVPVDLFRRWGLRTLGDLAALPAPALSARVGQDGLRWQRLARGEDLEPLVARPPEPPIEETLDLDWPVEGLEPLSFLLPRLLDPICTRLERADQAAVSIELVFRLATREQVTRSLQLPAPMRDAKVLRTLVLLHLESHPLGGGIERLTVRVEPAPARIMQFSLLTRARPVPEQMATLLARLGALMGERRIGSPALLDSHRPGAFAMERFDASQEARATPGKKKGRGKPAGGAEGWAQPPGGTEVWGKPAPAVVIRRLALPVAARVLVQDGRPARVTTERQGLEGGRVEAAAGPWRTSGEWWRVGSGGDGPVASPERGSFAAASRGESNGTRPERGGGAAESNGWNRDEWDVALSDGAVYRIYRDRVTERWFVDGIVD